MTRPYEKLTLEQVAQYPRPGMAVPGRIDFTPDGKSVTYLASEDGGLVRSLWKYDVAAGTRSVIAGPSPASTSEGALSREEELRRERARLRELGVTDYQFAKKAPQETLLIPGGARLRLQIGDAALYELDGTEGALDARLSPDGSQVAFAREGELFVVPAGGGEPRRLTTGAQDGLTNGVAEFIAAEELDRMEGYWWSPASDRIAFVRADSRHIPLMPIVHQGKPVVETEHHRYPFAGQPNTYVDLGVLDLASGAITWMDPGADRDIYIAGVACRPDGRLTAEILSRDQRTLRLIEFDDAGKGHVLIEEDGDPWINLGHDTRFLESGEIVHGSEASGFRHLYLHDANGRINRQLTSGEWVVTALRGIDEQGRLAYFEGTCESVLERHLYRVLLDGGEPERLTHEPGWHATVMSHDCSRFVDTYSSTEAAPVVRLHRGHGESPVHLFESDSITADSLGLGPPQFMEVTATDGTALHGALYQPAGNGSTGAPLIVSVYGGPHAQRVVNAWAMTVDLRAQYLAQQGFAVFVLDNRGSANRGLAFEAHLHNRMGTVEVEDQAIGVEFLSRLDNIDTSRTGIYGWSYGGYMTCMAMMRRPGVFSVGVAGAPVSDWDGYDTGYTERYMGTPQSNPEGYRDGSVLTHAAKLEGKLLIVHGGVDENVHFRHTARLLVALTEAQKTYDLVIFPEERHMPRDAKGLEYMERRLARYFEEHL